MKDKVFLNKELKIMFMSCRDKKIKYGMSKVLTHFKKRLYEAADKEAEIIAIDSELRNLSLSRFKNKSID